MIKRAIALLLCCTLAFTACSHKNSETIASDTEKVPSTKEDKEKDNDTAANSGISSVIKEDNEADKEISTDSESVITESLENDVSDLRFSGFNDPALIQYVEDNIYANLEFELDTDEYVINNVNAVYISQEYIDELSYNSRSTIYFGYTLEELDDQFAGSKYVFTLGEDGSTDVEPLTEITDDTMEHVFKNVAIGSGVILICVTVSAVSGGLGAPAISAVFAASATKATSFALSSSVFGGVTSAIVTGYQTKDFEEALSAGILGASEGFKWGAIIGTITGGAETSFAIKKGNVQVTPRQSELDVLKKYKDAREQVSFLDGKEVKMGTKGATRPDIITKAREAIEVKNYDLKNNLSLLKRVLHDEISDRVVNLPSDMTQKIVLDVRGRGYSEKFLQSVLKEIQGSLAEIYPNIPVEFLRW